jgi:iron complex outermembrane receptor protein
MSTHHVAARHFRHLFSTIHPGGPRRRLVISPLLLTIACSAAVAADADQALIVTAPQEDSAPTNLDHQAMEHEIALTPGGVTLLDGDEFTHRQVSNLGDALRYAPGLWAVSTSGTSGITLSARGSNLDSKGYDTNGVRMLEDGLPITTADGNNHNRFISPLVVRQAVVARGANSLEYGGSTLGGTINFITPTAYDSPSLHGFVSGGSFGYLNGFASGAKVFDGGADAMVTLEGRTRDGYREHSKEQQVGVYANAGYRFTDGISTRLYVSYLDQQQELPGSLSRAQVDDDPDQANPWSLIGQHALDVEAYRIADKTSFRFTKTERLDLGLSYEHQQIHHPIVAAGQVPFPPINNGLLIQRKNDDGWLTARYAATWSNHEVVIGANYGISRAEEESHENNGGSAGPLWASADMDATTAEFYATDRWRVGDQWLVLVGIKAVSATREVVHYDGVGTETSDPYADYADLSPRLGVIWQVASNAEVFANASRLFEPPTLFQLGDDAAGGNHTLDAMTGTSFEFGGRGAADLGHGTSWNWEATAYYALIEDEILTVEEPPGSGNTFTGNVDHTIHAGIELAAGGSFPITTDAEHRLAPRASLTVNHFVFDDHELYGDNELPGAPGYFLRAELLYRHASGWYAGPTCDLVGSQYVDFTNGYQVDDYVLLGLRGGYEAGRWGFFVEVRNLLDEDYVGSVAVANDAAPSDAVLNPGEPLALYAGMEMSW